MSELILAEQANGVATVTLNRPEAMNALSKALRRRFHEVMGALSDDAGVRAIILTGAGDRAFCGGLDLKELSSDAGALLGSGGRSFEEDVVRAVETCSKPVIGAINGVAITGGFELALACDILIASRNARFADTHARVGVMPGWGLSQKLSRTVGRSRAKELSLTGNFLDAATAEHWGLVNRVVEPAELMPAAHRLAQDIASADPDMVRAYRTLIDDGFAMSFGEAMDLEHRVSSAANTRVTPESVAARRAGVQARGRAQ